MTDRLGQSTAARFAALVALAALCFAATLLAQRPAGATEAAGVGLTQDQPESCAFNRAAATEAYGQPLDNTIWGRLCQVIDGEPTFAEGVTVTVTQDGNPIGDATTGEDGVFVVPIPEPGVYQVALDPDELPEGFELTNEDRATLDRLAVNLGDQQARFGFGAAADTGRSFDDYASIVAKGVKLGLILAVAAVGLSLVFGVTGLVNFAHAELVTGGALAAYLANQSFGWSIWLAGLFGVAAASLLGWLNERVVWSPLRGRRMNNLSMMVVSIGLSILLRNVYQILASPDSLNYRAGGIKRELAIGPVRLPPNDWYICGIAVVVLVGFTLLLKRTRLGTSIRAVADNPDLAESSGIAVSSVIAKVWIISGALAGLGGILYGLSFKVQFNMGFTVLLSLFAAVVLGGLGSAYGAILGALIIGVVQETVGIWIDTDYKFVVALSVLIVVLLVRPQGILGTKERIG